MKRKLLSFVSVVIAMLTLASVSLIPASAINYTNGIKLKSKSALVINMDTGQTVFSVKADKVSGNYVWASYGGKTGWVDKRFIEFC